MKTIKFSPEEEQKYNEGKQKLIEKLKSNQNVLKVLESSRIPASEIENEPWMVYEWIQTLQICKECHSLNSCKQNLKGHIKNLRYDGVLQEVLTPCKYYSQYANAVSHQNQYYVADMSDTFMKASFENIILENETNEYLEVLTQVVDACRSNHGVYLYGTLGAGKSYLAACAANEKAKEGKRVAFIHYPSFIKRMTALAVTKEENLELERVKRCDFLVVDDVGAEGVTTYNRDQLLLPILTYRYDHELTTWFTSNLNVEALEEHFAEDNQGKIDKVKAARVMDRIMHLAEPIMLVGDNRRKTL